METILDSAAVFGGRFMEAQCPICKKHALIQMLRGHWTVVTCCEHLTCMDNFFTCEFEKGVDLE